MKKIPKMLLGKCEFGKEDYSLNIVNMPLDANAPEFIPIGSGEEKMKASKKKKSEEGFPNLFSANDGRGI